MELRIFLELSRQSESNQVAMKTTTNKDESSGHHFSFLPKPWIHSGSTHTLPLTWHFPWDGKVIYLAGLCNKSAQIPRHHPGWRPCWLSAWVTAQWDKPKGAPGREKAVHVGLRPCGITMEPVFAWELDNDSDSRHGMPRLKGALGKGKDPGLFLGSVPAWKLVHFCF